MPTASPSYFLDSNWTPGLGRLTLTLTNSGSAPLAGFRLAVTSQFRIRPGAPIGGGVLLEQISNYHVIAPPEGFTLGPGARWVVIADQLDHALSHYTYGPKSAYLILADGSTASVSVTPTTLAGAPGAPRPQPRPSPRVPERGPALAIVPWPARVRVSGRQDPARPIALVDGPELARAAFATVTALAGRLFPHEALLAAEGLRCTAGLNARLPEEGYRITFAAGAPRVEARDAAGFRHAFVTLGAMLRGARAAGFALPAEGSIEDFPRFPWRGFHLDVARQVYTIEEILRVLDCLAWSKLNRFHIHLNDDEGWRLDVPQYPALAEVAAWRGHGLPIPPLLGSAADRHGIVYFADDIRRIVAHAGDLGISVVPEIDIPGHCHAVLQAIPELRDPDETGVYRSVQNFPNNALNPALPATYEFLEAVFIRLAELFPAPWIHVGGDEVSDEAWLGSPLARRLMAEYGWHDVFQLQSYFLQRVQMMIRGLGRATGAWEEAALGGGIDAQDSYLVAWKRSASGRALAAAGYEVVLAPAEHAYLDMAQADDWWEPGAGWAGTVTPADCYAFDPGGDWPDTLKSRLMGVQACLWSENLDDRTLLNRLTSPRLSAIAETAWTPASAKDFARFEALAPLMPSVGG